MTLLSCEMGGGEGGEALLCTGLAQEGTRGWQSTLMTKRNPSDVSHGSAYCLQ